MARVSKEDVEKALSRVKDPCTGKDVMSTGMISGLAVKDGNVSFAIEVDPDRGKEKEPLRKACEKAVDALDGVLSVTAVLTAFRPPPDMQQAPGRGNPEVMGVKALIAVASGKGGVGKSTTTVNLALAMAQHGHKVGVLDADIYGPSVPRMMGIRHKPTSDDGKKLIPVENYGVKCMSMGFLVDEDSPMIWRGPMVMSALEQMLHQVAWGTTADPLDVLFVDMPPGTGDAQLTMAQRAPLTGAIIVSTPQDIALLDARKGLNMFRKVDVPVFGIIENMSYFICPHCGERSEIFSHGGAKQTAENMGCEFLGEIPLDMAIRETSDGGHPIVMSKTDSEHAKAYMKIGERVGELIEQHAGEMARGQPNIVFE